MLTLTPDEQEWLDEYIRILDENYPGLVEEIIVYGSKARGDAHQDSDVDILVRIKEGDRKLKKAISMEHFEATIGKYMLPMVMVCTDEDRQRWNIESTSFVRAVQRDGVAVR